MSKHMTKASDRRGLKRKARLGTSQPQVIGRANSKGHELKKTEACGSEAKRKREGWSVRQIDAAVRRCERWMYVSMLLLFAVYILDDGYIFYGCGGISLIR